MIFRAWPLERPRNDDRRGNRAVVLGGDRASAASAAARSAGRRAVTPGRDTLVSVNDTLHMSAVGRDHAGAVLPNAAFAWTSSDAAVATVGGATGIVTALKNGTVTITAASNEKTATATIVVRQRAASMEMLAGRRGRQSASPSTPCSSSA